jgi:serine/threonine-protein kinase HipA
VRKRLNVWWDNRLVGELTVDRHGEMRFRYAEDWRRDQKRRAISISLPKREKAFSRRECRPFFGGLLPEARQRVAVAKALGVSEANDFKLLDALGGDVAGALTLLPEGAAPSDGVSDTVARALTDEELKALLEELPVRPLLAGKGGLRLSLAGAQPKLPVVMEEGRIKLPAPGQATTHIIKPPILGFPGITENEYLGMTLASRCGLDTAPVETRMTGNVPYLLVTRYDRVIQDGKARRLHQEDFAQALGVPADRKYASEGGPTVRQSVSLVRKATTVPALEVLKFVDALLFNLIIGNADAHAKNYSLLYLDDSIVMAPLYDLVSTSAYPDLSADLAMPIGRQRRLEQFEPRHWPVFAEETGVTVPFLRRRAVGLAQRVEETILDLAEELSAPGLDGAVLRGCAERIADRGARLRLKAV